MKRDELEREVVTKLAGYFHMLEANIEMESNLRADLGAHESSVDALLSWAGKKYNVDLGSVESDEIDTVDDFVAVINLKLNLEVEEGVD